jgi:hypothetical protein
MILLRVKFVHLLLCYLKKLAFLIKYLVKINLLIILILIIIIFHLNLTFFLFYEVNPYVLLENIYV